METLIIFASCQMTGCAQEAATCQSGGCDRAVCITVIICLTVLLLSIVLANMLCRMKNKQLMAKQEEEKEIYRSKLVNIYEIQAKGLKTQDRHELNYNKDWCNAYIAELKSLINDFKPTDQAPPASEPASEPAPELNGE